MADPGILVAVRVTPAQARLLQAMAQRAGEISWSWPNCRPDVLAMGRDLLEKGLIEDLRDRAVIRLTDRGRSAVAQIEYANQRARIIQA